MLDVSRTMVAGKNLRVAFMRINHFAALRQITLQKFIIESTEALGAERVPAGKTVTGEYLTGIDLRAHESACLGATTAQARCVRNGNGAHGSSGYAESFHGAVIAAAEAYFSATNKPFPYVIDVNEV